LRIYCDMTSSSSSSSSSPGSSAVISNLTDKVSWFSEVNDQWPGVAMSFQISQALFDDHSPYQHVQVFKTPALGNVLVLDGVIQLTEKDEMAYQEMITHLPLFSHPNPESVLVVGGGDGGVLREVLKHKSVQSVTICEIDDMVISASQRFLPSVSVSWKDKRVHLVKGDAAEYLAQPERKGQYDCIICDSSDPVGPAESLFKGSFYKCMSEALKPGGKVSTQAESIWLHLDLIRNLIADSRPYFANVEYASSQVPTYPLGQIGFLLCSKAEGKTHSQPISCREPLRPVPADMPLRYYSSEMHRAAFVLPAFAAHAISAAASSSSSASSIAVNGKSKLSEVVEAKKAAEPAATEPKKRGRPSARVAKAQKADWGPVAATPAAPVHAESAAASSEAATPRKRGRPKKAVGKGKTEAKPAAPSGAKRGRGRPKKLKTDDET